MNTENKNALDAVTPRAEEGGVSTANKSDTSIYNIIIERLNNIPLDMRKCKNWLVRKGKIPYSPITHKQGNSVDVCGTFRDALIALKTGQYDGIGFHFDNTPFTGIDLDYHVEGGALDEMAMQIFIDCASYTEYSPSGTGLHIIVKGTTPQSIKNSHLGLEMYSQGRYFTITGNLVQGSPSTVEYRQGEIQTLYDTFAVHPVSDIGTGLGGISLEPVYNDVEILPLIARIMKSKQGDKFTRLYSDGDLSDYEGDASRADAGLLAILEFWTKGNPQLMHDIFNRSALAKRDKWQNGNTGHNPMYYRALTIRRVIARQEYNRKREHEQFTQDFIDSFYD